MHTRTGVHIIAILKRCHPVSSMTETERSGDGRFDKLAQQAERLPYPVITEGKGPPFAIWAAFETSIMKHQVANGNSGPFKCTPAQ